MKKIKAVMGVLILLVALFLVTIQVVSAKTTVTTCVGTMTMVDIVEGTMSFTGETFHVRDRALIYQTSFPGCPFAIDGLNSVVANLNWDSPDLAISSGPVWGKFYKEVFVDPDSGFSGSYTGMKSPEQMVINIVGHGFGIFAGLKVTGTIEYSGDPFFAIFTLNILDPGG